MRHLGIDYGTKKIGLALSDEAGTMGFPHASLPNDTRTLAAVRALIAKESVEAIVIGESRNLDGTDNPVALQARAFAEQLSLESGLPVHFEFEGFTSQEVRRAPDGTRGHTKKTDDASAAALILTSYLSHHGEH